MFKRFSIITFSVLLGTMSAGSQLQAMYIPNLWEDIWEEDALTRRTEAGDSESEYDSEYVVVQISEINVQADSKKIKLTWPGAGHNEYIKLDWDAAKHSITIKNMVDDIDAYNGEVIEIAYISRETLKHVCNCLKIIRNYYPQKQENTNPVLHEKLLKYIENEFPMLETVVSFFSKNRLTIVYELLLASNYFEIQPLLDACAHDLEKFLSAHGIFKGVDDISTMSNFRKCVFFLTILLQVKCNQLPPEQIFAIAFYAYKWIYFKVYPMPEELRKLLDEKMKRKNK